MPITFFKYKWRFCIVLIKNHNKFDKKNSIQYYKFAVRNDRPGRVTLKNEYGGFNNGGIEKLLQPTITIVNR